MTSAPEILILASRTPSPIARELYLGAKDRTVAYVPDDVALILLARFCGVSSPDDLTTLDFLIGTDHIDEVMGR